MLGAIIGDIAGSRFEFNNHRSKDFELFTTSCFATDDSMMTLAVAKALIEAGKTGSLELDNGAGNREYYWQLEKETIIQMQKIGRKYPDCGYGGRFGKWLFEDQPKPYNSYGNGAAMRISPAAWAARTETEARLYSEIITRVTHNHPEGLKGAEAVTLAIYMAKNGAAKEEIKARMEYFYRLNFTIDAIRDSYVFNESCQQTVPQAIVSFLESGSFEDAIRTAISIGGDSDTLAAITGAIAEAYYGIPAELEEKALAFLNDELRLIYFEFKNFVKKGPQTLFVRPAYETEKEEILKEGYKHFPKNRSLEEYISDNLQEDNFGTRYVLVNNDLILSSLIVLKLKNIFNVPVWGLGSIVTHGEMTGKGYATSLIKKCIESIEEKEDVFIFLYSDIRPDFYQRLGFKLLPDKLQKNKKSICMVRCGESNWEKLIKSLPEEIPDYF